MRSRISSAADEMQGDFGFKEAFFVRQIGLGCRFCYASSFSTVVSSPFFVVDTQYTLSES